MTLKWLKWFSAMRGVWWIFDWGESKLSYMWVLRLISHCACGTSQVSSPFPRLIPSVWVELSQQSLAVFLSKALVYHRDHIVTKTMALASKQSPDNHHPTNTGSSLQSSNPPSASLCLMWTCGRVSVWSLALTPEIFRESGLLCLL